MLFAGDILLEAEFGSWLSEGIEVKYNADISHCEPIINSKGDSMRMMFPKCCVRNIRDYFDGNHMVWIIRPSVDYTPQELRLWLSTLMEKEGKYYDFNFFRYLVNYFPKDKNNFWNCAEATLDSFQAIGRYEDIIISKVNPYSFEMLAHSGDFVTVLKKRKPTLVDLERILAPSYLDLTRKQ